MWVSYVEDAGWNIPHDLEALTADHCQPFELCSGYMVPVRLSSTGDSTVHIAGIGSVNCKHSSSVVKMTGVTQVDRIGI